MSKTNLIAIVLLLLVAVGLALRDPLGDSLGRSVEEFQGFVALESREPGQAPEYILISRFDRSLGYNVVEFHPVGEKNPIWRWIFNEADKYAFPPRGFSNPVDPNNSKTLRVKHPMLHTDGRLTFHFDNSPVYQEDICGNILWTNHDYGYHHSLEQDADGNFWVPGMAHQHTQDESWGDGLKDDFIVQLSPSGETLYARSVIDILRENNLENRIYVYDMLVNDPIHMNDIQPVLEDGLYWRKGDVFINIAHLNMLMLYRPSEERLLWYTQETVMHQHDVDILDDRRISVFDNRRTDRANGPMLLSHNEVWIIDFETGEWTRPWSAAFEKNNIATINQGLSDFGEHGGLFVEETNFGRLIKLSADGEVEWEFHNYRQTASIDSTMNWSRLIHSGPGREMENSLVTANCRG